MNIDMFINEDLDPSIDGNIHTIIIPEDSEEDDSKGEDEGSSDEEASSGLPVIPLRGVVLFPRVTMPVLVGRPRTKRLLDFIEKNNISRVLAFTQVDSEKENPSHADLAPYGVLCDVVRIVSFEEHMSTIILHARERVRLSTKVSEEPFIISRYTLAPDLRPDHNDIEYQVLGDEVRKVAFEIMQKSGNVPSPLLQAFGRLKKPEVVINLSASHVEGEVADRLALLFAQDLKQRAYELLKMLNHRLERVRLQQEVEKQTRSQMDQQQREYYLQQQMRVIKSELNEDEDQQVNELIVKAEEKKLPFEVEETFYKELKKLQRMPMQAPEYAIQTQYLQTILDLPWRESTKDNFVISKAEARLNKDHYGMEKVKERILEHLSVLKLRGDMRAPIICLYGPPGVGKTSLGQSIAAALNRKYVRISLGGLHDEAEIRGHRRTYIGAMPGRIIKAFIKAESNNPVFVLDEIDKLAKDYKGDPSSALLEVLDPEQNSTFHDNYLDIDYDLSKTLFIATANNIGDIPEPLRDRMEMIEVSGYLLEEKVEIARKHLLPRNLKEHGLDRSHIKVDKAALQTIINDYTRESGVRALDKMIAKLVRKVAMRKASGDSTDETLMGYKVTTDNLKGYLGPILYTHDQYENNKYAGVVTGLAWTSVGGEILMIESAVSPSKAGKMSITGNLGDVMKESAILALEYIKSHAVQYGIPYHLFDDWNVHIHVPEGATPKDGPSAGITLVTSLISTLTQRKVFPSIAMTGEITLRGKVLPVGGIKEKILAAKRAGIKTIILCVENRKDVEEIKASYLEGLSFIYVSDISEVIQNALSTELVEHPIDLSFRLHKEESNLHS